MAGRQNVTGVPGDRTGQGQLASSAPDDMVLTVTVTGILVVQSGTADKSRGFQRKRSPGCLAVLIRPHMTHDPAGLACYSASGAVLLWPACRVCVAGVEVTLRSRRAIQ